MSPWQSGQTLNVEIEPCSDVRWARIERELFAKLDAGPIVAELPVDRLVEDLLARPAPRSRAWVAAAASLGAIAAAVTLVAFVRTSSPGAHSGEPVTLTTTDTGMQFVVGESELTMAPRSRLVVNGDDEHGIDVSLDRGAVTCEVAPRHGRPPFRVDAGDVHVRVIGTLFTVARDPASVAVSHGIVEVTARDQVTLLHDGERWPALPSTEGAGANAAAPGTNDGTLSPTTAQAKTASRPTHGRRAHAVSSAPGSDPADDDFPLPSDTPAAPSAPEGANTPETANVPTSSAAQQTFEAATRNERTHPERAVAAYRQLAAGTTPWAPNALFALARLEADRGHKGEAAELLRSYLARYPQALNAADARELLQRLQ